MMDKDEIPAKSREENKHRDPYEQETLRLATLWSNIAIMAIVFIQQVAHLAIKGEFSAGAWAIITGYQAADHAVKALRRKKLVHVFATGMYALLTIGFMVLYFRELCG